MTDWITDEHGNRASIAYWGSEDRARASLASLTDCRNCTNCSDCSRCSGCSYCSYCSGCSYCSYCSYCSDCSYCSYCSYCSQVKDVNRPVVVGPIRSDGYQFVMGAGRSIHAGCRVFVSLAEAREHWQTTRGGTKLGTESLLILDQIEALAALRS